MRTRALLFAVALGAVGAGGCTDTDPMNAQAKYEPFERSDFFADTRAMRPLLEDTVPQEWRARVVPGPSGETGLMPDGTWAQRVPVPLTRELLETGRVRYDAFCAVCHGLNGNGESIVAMNMEARRPPSLIAPHDHTREVVYGSAEDLGPYPDKRYVGANAVSPSMRAVIAEGVLEKDRRDRPGPLDKGRPAGGPTPPGGLASGRPSTTGMETREAPDASTLLSPLLLGEGQGEGRGPRASGAEAPGARDGGLGGAASGGTAHVESAFDTPAAASARRTAGDGQSGVSLTGRSAGPAAAGDLPHPPGYYFTVITEGYGVMPAYAEMLTPRERWAVVAWLRVLARSQSTPLDSAPPEVRQQLLQSLQGGTTP